MCGNARTLRYVSVFDFLKVNVCTSITGSARLDAIMIRYIQYSIKLCYFTNPPIVIIRCCQREWTNNLYFAYTLHCFYWVY